VKFDPRDWPAISALFDEALELPAGAQARWLDALPPERRAHRATIERLLADHARAETADFLGALPLMDLATKTGAARAAGGEVQWGQWGPRTVGPYRLLRELGRGGMGSVWLAERTDGVLKRAVALKLPHPGIATRMFAERLARERDILAALTHPHIARLYDADITAEGQPYLALAYVEGLTLVAHCDACGLDVPARIGLFLQVLSAVQYAHSHLIIHRDLKPSNVLVDAEGQVHLLDFGIAKLLVEGQAQATELTLDAGPVLTPDYASPEQLAGATIGTASDVYSLGVLLFELLAGARPYRLERDGRGGLRHTLDKIEVPAPSAAARVAGGGDRARRLRGDLDTIVLKALRRSPDERYRTVDAFADDLRRYLDGEPVLARPDALGYRVGKFVRRHRVGVAAVATSLVLLGAGLAGTTWQARRAQQQTLRAQAVQDFLVGLFNEADPAKAQGRELTARQMLDRGRRDLQMQLTSQPDLMATVQAVLVDLYIKLGDESKVLPIAQDQADRALKRDGPDSLAYGDALYALARVHGGLDHHALALQTYERARLILARHTADRQTTLLLIEGHASKQLAMLDRSREAIARLTELLPRIESRFGATSWEWLQSAGTLAEVYTDVGENGKAGALIERIAPQLDRADAAHAMEAAELRAAIGYALWNARQYAPARTQLERAIRDADRLLGTANTLSVDAQRTLGLLYVSQGNYVLAAKTYGDSAQRSRQLSGEDAASTRYAESFGVLPLVFTGRSDEARDLALNSVKQLSKIEGITPAVAVGFDRRLALALLFAGEEARSATVLESVLTREKAAGIRDGRHGTTLLYLAGARAAMGRDRDAAEAASEAARVFATGEVNVAGGAHAKLTEALAQARSGNHAAAESLVGEAKTLLDRSVRANPADPLYVDLVRAELLRTAGHVNQALELDRHTRELLKSVAGVVVPVRLVLVI